jgi:monovalent cation/hydrogen antiporter
VLAVVVTGLIMSQAGPRVIHADTRQLTEAFWTLSTFLLNGSLFVLVGLELLSAVRGLASAALARGLVAVAAVSAAVIGARFAWLFTTPYLIRLLDRRPQQRLRRVGARARVVSGLAGFRGAVSLAAALAVPETVTSGAPFPDRDTIIFVTSGVIVVTLVLQGLLLPVVVRWARLPHDDSVEQERHLAETLATEEAIAAIPQLAADLGTDSDVVGRLRREVRETPARPARRRRRRPRRAGAAIRAAVRRPASGRDRPQTGHRGQVAGRTPHRRHRPSPGPRQARHRGSTPGPAGRGRLS